MSIRDGGPRKGCKRERGPAQGTLAGNFAGEAASSPAPMEQQLVEARFLAAFCRAVYAHRDPTMVCATAMQLLQDYFGHRLAHFSFVTGVLESVSFVPPLWRDPFSNVSPTAPPHGKRGLTFAGTAGKSGFDVTVRFPAADRQPRISKAEQQSYIPSGDFLQDITDCLAAAHGMALEHSRLQELSMRDGLTGLLNRRAFEDLLDIEAERRDAPSPSVVMIDIDDFKSINDRFGHPAGDQVIAAVGKDIVDALRGTDLAARYGGEEFAVFLPATTVKDAFAVAQRLRSRIASLSFDFSGQQINVTASLGVASRCENGNCSVRDVLKQADEALYQAKRSGKNRALVNTVSPSAGPRASRRRGYVTQSAGL